MSSNQRLTILQVKQMIKKQIKDNNDQQQQQFHYLNSKIKTITQKSDDYFSRIHKISNQIQILKKRLNQQINQNKKLKSDIKRLTQKLNPLRQNNLQIPQIKKCVHKPKNTDSFDINIIKSKYLNQKLKDYKIDKDQFVQKLINQQKSIKQQKSINQQKSTKQNSRLQNPNYQESVKLIRFCQSYIQDQQNYQAFFNLNNQNISQSQLGSQQNSQIQQILKLQSLQNNKGDFFINKSKFIKILTSSICGNKKINKISSFLGHLSKYILSVYKTNPNNLIIPTKYQISTIKQVEYSQQFMNQHSRQQYFQKSINLNPQQIPQKNSKQYFYKALQYQQKLVTFIFQRLKLSKNYPFMKQKIQRFIHNKQLNEQLFKQTYYRMTDQLIDYAYNNYNNTSMTRLSYKLKIQKFQLIPQIFYETNFVDVQFFECYLNFTAKFVTKLFQNIDKMFPNLKILCLDDGHTLQNSVWQVLADHSYLLKDIQALIIHNSRIQIVNQKQLDNLKDIKKLRYFYLGSKYLFSQSKDVINKFKWNNRNIKFQYIR